MVVLGGHEEANGALLEAAQSFSTIDGYEAIVVDNGADVDKAFVAQPETRVSQVIKNGFNAGFARAANQGGKAAKGDYLLFLNPDISLTDKRALLRLLEVAEGTAGGGVFAPRLKGHSGEDMPWGGYFHFRWSRLLSRIWPSMARPTLPKKGKVETDWVAATAMLVSRQLWSSVDGFAEEYYMYFEDVDFCFRLKKENFPSFLVADAEIVHEGGGTYRQRPHERKLADYRVSRNTFFRKHAPLRGWLLQLLDLMAWGRYNRPQ